MEVLNPKKNHPLIEKLEKQREDRYHRNEHKPLGIKSIIQRPIETCY